MTPGAAGHDQPTFLATMREHLSRHDRPLAFLFGAGTSCSVLVSGTADPNQLTKPLIPDVNTLTAMCQETFTADDCKYKHAWPSIVDRCDVPHKPHIEHILSMLRMMCTATSPSEQLAGLNKNDLQCMESTLRKNVAEIVSPPPSCIPLHTPHRKFAQWLAKTNRQQPVEVFTVNYDILFELAFEAERLPFFDGFVGSHKPFFHPDSLLHQRWAPAAGWTRLWKIHGSVSWHRDPLDNRIYRGEPSTKGEMIFPTFEKYDQSRQQPYVAYINRLDRFLEQDNALLVVVGFGFGDRHLNDIVIRRLESNPRTHVYALLYSADASLDSRLSSYAMQRGNLIIFRPNEGIIGGRRKTWTSSDSSDPVALGDFAVFCRFLGAMTND